MKVNPSQKSLQPNQPQNHKLTVQCGLKSALIQKTKAALKTLATSIDATSSTLSPGKATLEALGLLALLALLDLGSVPGKAPKKELDAIIAKLKSLLGQIKGSFPGMEKWLQSLIITYNAEGATAVVAALMKAFGNSDSVLNQWLSSNLQNLDKLGLNDPQSLGFFLAVFLIIGAEMSGKMDTFFSKYNDKIIVQFLLAYILKKDGIGGIKAFASLLNQVLGPQSSELNQMFQKLAEQIEKTGKLPSNWPDSETLFGAFMNAWDQWARGAFS